MKASGKIGSSGVEVSDNVEQRFETDLHKNFNMPPTSETWRCGEHFIVCFTCVISVQTLLVTILHFISRCLIKTAQLFAYTGHKGY